MAGDGTHRWGYVSQPTNNEWFYVTYWVLEDGFQSEQMLLIPSAAYLLGLASTDTPKAHVSDIQIVSPPWLNGKKRWLMEPLRSIRIAENRFCYELTDGEIYPAESIGRGGETVWVRRSDSDE